MNKTLTLKQEQAYQEIVKSIKSGIQHYLLIGVPNCGKSYVCKMLIERDFYEKKILVIVPTHTLRNQWFELLNYVTVITYQSLHKLTKKDINKFSLIIFDEAHHIGAPKWGAYAKSIFRTHKGSIVSCTATPIRSDNIDVHNIMPCDTVNIILMDIESALNSNIFVKVQYINAAYNNPENLTLYQEFITDLYQKYELGLPKNKKAREKLAPLFNVIEKTYSKPNLLKNTLLKYVGNGVKKTLVFCQSIKEMEKYKMFYKNVFPNASVYCISSKYPTNENVMAEKLFAADTNKAFMLSVDMISEGYHLKDIDSVVLMRRTNSHVRYFQQIGRVLFSTKYKNKSTNNIILDLASCEFRILHDVEKFYIRKYKINIVDELAIQFAKSEMVQYVSYVSDITKQIGSVLKEIYDYKKSNWTKENIQFLIDNYGKENRNDNRRNS